MVTSPFVTLEVFEAPGYVSGVTTQPVTASGGSVQAIVINIPPGALGVRLQAAILFQSNVSGFNQGALGVGLQAWGVAPTTFDYSWTASGQIQPGPYNNALDPIQIGIRNADLSMNVANPWQGMAILNGWISGSTSGGQVVIYISAPGGYAVQALAGSAIYASWP